jgi:ubiquinone/menaquinone biosynthesis C-methylase UbiE
MSRRTAESHAAFFLPHLRPGMRLLDCGCGPGGITVGLAQRVSPGEAIGIDVGDAQLRRARERASAGNVRVTFREASVYSLPFRDTEFDVAFSHALFEHLAEPLKALWEIRRVLKPGGCVGLRSPDWGGFVLHPWSENLANALADYQTLQRANGGDVFAGRNLAAWLRQAQFVRVQPSAVYEIYPSATLIADYLAQQLDSNGRDESAAVLRDWAKEPDAMFAQAWFEAIGYKD